MTYVVLYEISETVDDTTLNPNYDYSNMNYLQYNDMHLIAQRLYKMRL